MWRSEITSYPPPFRQTDLQKRPSSASDEGPIETLDVPVIDLQHPNGLSEACRDWGLFRLINHGIPQPLSNQLRYHAMNLFSLPFESKQTQFTDPIAYFWGTPVLKQSVLNLNRVEGFHAPLPKLVLQQQHGRTLGEKEAMIDSFRCVLEEYGHHMGRIARTVFNILAENLALDTAQMASYLAESDGLLRIYRYPCNPPGDEDGFGLDAHTDSSVLSILNQDEVGGLQVLWDQKWVHVKPIHDTLIVNLGDMMQAISNEQYKSAMHRVRVKESGDRMSICYFGFPMEDEMIVSSNYKPFTYSEFRTKVEEDIRTTGFKVGLQRFKIGDALF